MADKPLNRTRVTKRQFGKGQITEVTREPGSPTFSTMVQLSKGSKRHPATTVSEVGKPKAGYREIKFFGNQSVHVVRKFGFDGNVVVTGLTDGFTKKSFSTPQVRNLLKGRTVRIAVSGFRDSPQAVPEVAVGHQVDHDVAVATLNRVAEEARDLFETKEAALKYLGTPNFDDRGVTALELIQRGNANTVVARLNELRFGSQG